MRLNAMKSSVVVLALVCGVAEATPITYALSYAVASETVMGTITTDGTIGAINAANITAWSFTETGPQSFAISSAGLGASIICQSTLSPTFCGLTASTTSLLFDFTHNSNTLLFRGSAGIAPALEFVAQQAFVNGPVGYFLGRDANPNDFPVVYCNPCSSATIATVAATSTVPEPSAFALLMLGFAGWFASKTRVGERVTRRFRASVPASFDRMRAAL